MAEGAQVAEEGTGEGTEEVSGFKDATFYAQVEPEWGHAYLDNDPPLRRVKVVRMTQSKPSRPIGGTVMVKLTLRIPESAFRPLRPEAVVVIPEDSTVVQPIEVEAVDPS